MIARLIVTLIALAVSPALAQQVPPPGVVPALPDSERRTVFIGSGSVCACTISFALYGDGGDFQNWIVVFLNGVRVEFNDPNAGWTVSSPSGPLISIARPITNAVLTFNAPQDGAVEIVGARRPRRAAQFSENSPVPTRSYNQVFTDLTAQNRERWDKINDLSGRALASAPGNSLALLPPPSQCANKLLTFDATGLIPQCTVPIPAQPPVTASELIPVAG
jgi:hypothetical protein